LSASGSSRKPPAPHVAIVGGGLAGLAAAASLVGHDVRITLFESRPRLGGRASSFQDPVTGEMVDNCQHVSMACCTNLAHFCSKVGISHLFRRVPDVLFLSPEGRLSRLAAGFLPAPLHLSGSFLRANYLGWFERLRVAYGIACLVKTPLDRPDEPFEGWLRRHSQTDRTIERYWGTVLISALNERLDRMDASHARKVFIDGFLRNRDGYRMEIPLAPLGEIYGSRLERWLMAEGVEVRLSTGVKTVEVDDEGHLKGLRLRSGEEIDADFVVLATPFDRVAGFFPEAIRDRIPSLKDLDQIDASPITGVHLWFDRKICPHEHVVTVGRLVQWVFDHSAIQGRSTPDGQGQYLQVVISASYDLLPLDKNQILEAVLTDLAAIWPESKEAKLVRSWVVTEHGATFAVRPGIDSLRPAQRTPVEGLFLAGDWTTTGWPATMEGAVRSGYLAAEGILEDLRQPGGLIQPDLPAGWLARLLLGAKSPVKKSRIFQVGGRSPVEVFDSSALGS
jgi:squalene-associated FAD-dependent desaturase